jgi:tetratricopeptide (TPR) repeat protein
MHLRSMIKEYHMIVLILLALTTLLLADVNQGKIKKGIEAYEKEQWDEALNSFQDALLDDPENPRLLFNVGSVQYQKQKYEEALQSFEKSLLTKDVRLQKSVYYNIGNTYYQLNKYQESIQAYKKALDLDPTDQDAKYNLELVRAKLKEMADKQQQQNQQQQQIEPSEYAKQLKAQADALVAQRFYKEAYKLMEQGLQSDPTVAAFQTFINRLKDVVDIEEGVTS